MSEWDKYRTYGRNQLGPRLLINRKWRRSFLQVDPNGHAVINIGYSNGPPFMNSWGGNWGNALDDTTLEDILKAVEVLKKAEIPRSEDGYYKLILTREQALTYRINTAAILGEMNYEEWSRRIGQMHMLRRLSERHKSTIFWPETVEGLGP